MKSVLFSFYCLLNKHKNVEESKILTNTVEDEKMKILLSNFVTFVCNENGYRGAKD